MSIEIQHTFEIEFFNKLIGICREQLHSYPKESERNGKQIIKSVVKKILFRHSKKDRYFWPNSILAIAIETSYVSFNDNKDINCLISYYDKWIDSGLKIDYLDNIMNGYSMVYVFKQTKDIKYKKALEILANYLIEHPKDKYGSLPYRELNQDIYVDSIGMICPFLCRYGGLTNNQNLINLAIIHIINFIKYGMDEKKHLPYHAYNADTGIKKGIVGWGRGVGWLLIGLVDSIEFIDASNCYYKLVVEFYETLVNKVIKFQRQDGHFSWQLEAIEGPADSSATSMIAYAIIKGIKIGLLDEVYLCNTQLAISALHRSTDSGNVGDCSAECRGLSMYPQNYGSFPWAQGYTTALLAVYNEVLMKEMPPIN